MSASPAITTISTTTPTTVVLDSNIVLDALVFADPSTHALLDHIRQGQMRWIATLPMRAELERVLGYPKIEPRLAFYRHSAASVLAQFDALVQLCPVPNKASVTCRDGDDQKFIDLAVQHQALLLSKDKAVLCMAKRLIPLCVATRRQLAPPPPTRTQT